MLQLRPIRYVLIQSADITVADTTMVGGIIVVVIVNTADMAIIESINVAPTATGIDLINVITVAIVAIMAGITAHVPIIEAHIGVVITSTVAITIAMMQPML